MSGYLRIFLIFVAGAVVGRFLVPHLEPKEVHHVAIGAEPDANTCPLIMEHTTTFLGRMTLLTDENDVLGCSEARDFPGVSIHCRCMK